MQGQHGDGFSSLRECSQHYFLSTVLMAIPFRVPLGAVAFLAACIGMPWDFPYQGQPNHQPINPGKLFSKEVLGSVDVLGTLLVLLAALSLTAGFEEAGSQFPWKVPLCYYFIDYVRPVMHRFDRLGAVCYTCKRHHGACVAMAVSHKPQNDWTATVSESAPVPPPVPYISTTGLSEADRWQSLL